MKILRRELITITPEYAQQLLEKEGPRRPISQGRIEQYARQMTDGLWNGLNGETIKISCSGNVSDGRHRLHSVIKSGKSILMEIAYDIPDDAFKTIDIGRNRSGADIFYLRGEKNCIKLSAIVDTVYSYVTRPITHRRIPSTRSNLTHDIRIAFLEDHPTIRDSIRFVSSDKYYKLAKISILGACHYIFNAISPEHTYNFFDGLVTGANLVVDSPILKLREALLQDKVAIKKMTKIHQFALIIISWNYYRQNRAVKFIRWTSQGVSTQKFPTAI